MICGVDDDLMGVGLPSFSSLSGLVLSVTTITRKKTFICNNNPEIATKTPFASKYVHVPLPHAAAAA
jgi:hypothetical protein